MRMPGSQQHGCTTLGNRREPLREGVERGQGPRRIDHILPGNVPQIG